MIEAAHAWALSYLLEYILYHTSKVLARVKPLPFNPLVQSILIPGESK